MRTAMVVAISVMVLVQSVIGAERVARAQRDVEWSLVTLDKVEKDLVGLCKSEKVPVPQTLAGTFGNLRNNARELKKKMAANPSREQMAVATKVARMAAETVAMIDERAAWIDELRSGYREAVDEDKRLATKELATRLEQAVHTLVTSLIDEVTGKLTTGKAGASGAEVKAGMAVSRYEFAVRAAWEALTLADERAELVEAMEDVGFVVHLDQFNAAAEKMKAARQQKRKMEIAKLEVEMRKEELDAREDAIGEALDMMEEATERAEDEFEEVMDGMWEEIDKAEEEEDEED